MLTPLHFPTLLAALALTAAAPLSQAQSTNAKVPGNPPATQPTRENLSIDLGGGMTLDFVRIDPGSFTMGSNKSREWDEKPAHLVTITKPFYLAKYEVTQEQWEKVMGGNPSIFKGARNPVDGVSWTDCQSFMAKLMEKVPGRTFRLPTEAEWEYACRAGSNDDYCYGEGEDSLAEYAWYRDNSGKTTHPVGAKRPNAWGLYDMHGNVWEWCVDWHGGYPTVAVNDPQGASGRVVYRVYRGGDCGHGASYCRAAYRYYYEASAYDFRVGLRLVLGPVP
jgi:formylglycine-generating enzyme required for sulfatase activity